MPAPSARTHSLVCGSAVAAHASEQRPMKATPRPSLHGKWVKDPKASDMQAMARAIDLMRLGGIQKHCALNLINGLEIAAAAEGEVAVRFLTDTWVVKHFTCVERFVAGKETVMSRRDKRRGSQRAKTLRLEPDHMHVHITWGGSLPGQVEERYVINTGGQLEVHSLMQVDGGPPVSVLTVYERASGGK